jgi:hypothetical protein
MADDEIFTYWGVTCPHKNCFVPLWKGERNEAHFDVWPQNVICPECRAAFNGRGPDALERRRSRKPLKSLWNPSA